MQGLCSVVETIGVQQSRQSIIMVAMQVGDKNMVDLEYAIGEILKLQGEYDVEFYDSPDDE